MKAMSIIVGILFVCIAGVFYYHGNHIMFGIAVLLAYLRFSSASED